MLVVVLVVVVMWSNVCPLDPTMALVLFLSLVFVTKQLEAPQPRPTACVHKLLQSLAVDARASPGTYGVHAELKRHVDLPFQLSSVLFVFNSVWEKQFFVS